MVKVILAKPRGFCAGVIRAIDIVELALDTYNSPIYVYHEIVHNAYVVEKLQHRGVIFVSNISDIPENSVTIFSAHGVSSDVEREAKERFLNVIDATCPLVAKVHYQAKNLAQKGSTVLIVGHEGHEEVDGTKGRIDGAFHIISTPEEASQVVVSDPTKVGYVTQTTLGLDDTKDIIATLTNRFPKIEGPSLSNICYATQNRQNAVRDMVKHIDLLLVVGAANSSNSTRLCELGKSLGVRSYLIADETKLQKSWLKGIKKIGVTAGASAPEVLVEGVLKKLEKWTTISISAMDGQDESVVFNLPNINMFDNRASDLAYQNKILQKVSRSFALTIPQLPKKLVDVISNGYLLCRLVDTIEDDTRLGYVDKIYFLQQLVKVFEDRLEPKCFIEELLPRLSKDISSDEKNLLENIEKIVRVTHGFSKTQQYILMKCIQVMVKGMSYFQSIDISSGLPTQKSLDHYCYSVAGVVGEMLTELFCEYSADIAENRTQMLEKSISFGKGLQMTNILKDIWEDYERDICWLPNDIFEALSIDLKKLPEEHSSKDFADGMAQLISIAHTHLCNALEYTLSIPVHEKGLRKFCALSIGMSLFTLKNINKNPSFCDGAQIKISRARVKAITLTVDTVISSNAALKNLFSLASKGLSKSTLLTQK